MNSDLSLASSVRKGSDRLELVLLQEFRDQHILKVPVVSLCLLVGNTPTLIRTVSVSPQAHSLN